jgi:hypothetical protein
VIQVSYTGNMAGNMAGNAAFEGVIRTCPERLR